MNRKRHAFLIALFAVAFSGSAYAEESDSGAKHHRHRHVLHHSRAHHGRHYSRAVYMRPLPASFVVDANTGKVLEAENPDALRYPASLTKMMTLYLTFDALKHGKLRFDQTIPVSQHAANQPQTNIALQPGDRIAVKDAILSIVVRSANDSAVTLAEALGGTESQFAEKMTAKAHALGMKHTEFRNGSGLPEPLQHTTARDMVKLGLALRTQFPEYFPLFKTESFTYHGITYITHNHVMTRYDGVDGIKTGYIRASGFNVVTSANRDGHHIIAVVMGGTTWRARDDKMIALLDRSFSQFASPAGSRKGIQVAYRESRSATSPLEVQAANDAAEGEGDLQGDAVRTSATVATNWGVQVGTFAQTSEASQAAALAVRQAPGELGASAMTIIDDKSGASTVVHRAQLINLTQVQAETACRKLSAMHETCFAYKMN